MLEHSNNSR